MTEDKRIHIDSSTIRKGIPEYLQDMPCPKCGKPATDGFGLAGGGFGIYNYCEDCGEVVSKSLVDDA